MLATASAWTPVAATCAVAFLYYRRARTHFGRQQYKPVRAIVRLVMLALVGILLGLLAASGHAPPWPMAAGALGGFGLGLVALRTTHVESGSPAFYTPNPWIGALLTLLLVGRLAWRYFNDGWAGAGSQPHLTPAMVALLGMLLGYALTYGAGLYWQVRRGARGG